MTKNVLIQNSWSNAIVCFLVVRIIRLYSDYDRVENVVWSRPVCSFIFQSLITAIVHRSWSEFPDSKGTYYRMHVERIWDSYAKDEHSLLTN